MIMDPPAYGPTQRFPRTAFKVLAGFSIALGITIILVAAAQIINSVQVKQKCDRKVYYRHFDTIMQDDMVFPDGSFRQAHDSDSSDEFETEPHLRWINDAVDDLALEDRCEIFSGAAIFAAIICACCAIVFIVTGSLGVGAARTMYGHRQSGLKTGFIVLNILNVLGFGPVVFMIGTLVAKAAPIVIQNNDYYTGHVITGHVIAFMGIVVTLISLVSASVSCCFAPTEELVEVIPFPEEPFDEMLTPEELQFDEKVQIMENEGPMMIVAPEDLQIDEKAQIMQNQAPMLILTPASLQFDDRAQIMEKEAPQA